MRGNYSVNELAETINQWCQEHRVEPLHNGAGQKVTVRNVRYYQSLGLVDRPVSADGHGFTERHRLQLVAIRLLQAKGLPLGKIQSLLYGRTEQELREIETRGLDEISIGSAPPRLQPSDDWKVVPIDPNILLLTRSGRDITAAQRLKIQEI